MKQMWLFFVVLVGLLTYQVYDKWITSERAKCFLFRYGECVKCDDVRIIPVGYRENCVVCRNREAYYVDEGLFPAWQCTKEKIDGEVELPVVSLSTNPCPKHHPLKDILGNCYACDTDVPVRIAHKGKGAVCDKIRYSLPDQMVEKSVKCPELSAIIDPEVCLACGGNFDVTGCSLKATNHFCTTRADCTENEWCYPLRYIKEGEGICVSRPTGKWFCSGTDGYDLESTQKICDRLGMKIPTLEAIEHAEEDLSQLCPTLDMWTFFAQDGAVWLKSFADEFLFTREGESDKLGGHAFYALCHKE